MGIVEDGEFKEELKKWKSSRERAIERSSESESESVKSVGSVKKEKKVLDMEEMVEILDDL